jgi:hypothetical protein
MFGAKGILVEGLVDRLTPIPAEPEDNQWVPVVDDLQRQIYYRQLGMVSMHGPVTEVVPAAAYLAKNRRGGTVTWITPGWTARWENVEVYPGITMNEWLYGGPRNTVLMRVGFYKLYMAESLLGSRVGR